MPNKNQVQNQSHNGHKILTIYFQKHFTITDNSIGIRTHTCRVCEKKMREMFYRN